MSTPVDYVRHGWALVPIPSGHKGPTTKGWNARERAVTTVERASKLKQNIGLAHAYSGTCAIDFDDLKRAAAWLAEHGVYAAALLSAPDAVRISSGRPNRAKLLYRLTTPLPSIKEVRYSVGTEKFHALEFRCATAQNTTVQDVLPPSIHPDTGQPYVWDCEIAGDWRSLPTIPDALLNIWQSLISPDVSNRASDTSPHIEHTELVELLKHHDPDATYDDWLRVGMALHHETAGEDSGLDLWDEWSSRGSKYKGRDDLETHWRSFRGEGTRLVTAASLRVEMPASIDDFDTLPISEPSIDAPPALVTGALPALNFDRDENDFIHASKENLHLALGRPDYCGTPIVLDTFRDDIMLGAGTALRSLQDPDYERLGIWLERTGFKTIAHENLRRSVALVADDNRIDSAITWLEGLQWDGVHRIESFLVDYFAAADSPYTRAVSLYWWTAHAGRVMEPGCKVDMVPILIGKQGVGKSTGVAAIAPDPAFFVEVRLDQDDEEIARKIRGRLVGEIGELRGLQSRESESIKQLITMTHDTWTPKYVERARTVPRRVVFVGTTNQEEFLADETGNRRWLPVRVGQVCVDRIRADRLQLWAEARDLFSVVGVAYEEAERLAGAEHGAHELSDVWEESINRWLDGGSPDDLGGTTEPRRDAPFSLTDVLVGGLGLDIRHIKRNDELRAGKILRGLGFEKRQMRTGNKVQKLWCIPL